MINELRAVAIFVDAVRAGSFRIAARQLNVSLSAVSYNVAQLEKRVGNALIYRSTRKLSLTKEGEHLYEHAAELLSEISASLDDITGHGSALRGRLIVSATTALLHSTLNRKIAQFCKDNPTVDVEIHYSDVRLDLIRDGIDLVLRAGDMPDSSLKSKRISRIERKLVCSRSYYNSHKIPRKPEELDTWRWIRLTMMPGGRTLRKAGKSF